MKQTLLFSLLGITLVLHAQDSFRVENTNFTLSQGSYNPAEDERYLYNYNRLRLYYDYKKEDYFAKVIGDGISYVGSEFIDSNSFHYIEQLHSDTPFVTQSSWQHFESVALSAKLYRLYGGYQDDDNRLVVGLQNITMGVGHIWTPSNLFNPKNSYGLEPDETYGVLALAYTRYVGAESQLYGVISQKEDNSFKSALGLQTTLDTLEVGINTIYSKSTKMLGYTLQSDIADTGVQLRSEGAYIQGEIITPNSPKEEQSFFQGILGADYAFENGLNLTLETLYSSHKFSYEEFALNYNKELANNLTLSPLYLGTSLSYDLNIYLSTSLLYIESFNQENSRFVSPTLEYTINDNNIITLGAQLYSGANTSEFGMWDNSYYFKYVWSY